MTCTCRLIAAENVGVFCSIAGDKIKTFQAAFIPGRKMLRWVRASHAEHFSATFCCRLNFSGLDGSDLEGNKLANTQAEEMLLSFTQSELGSSERDSSVLDLHQYVKNMTYISFFKKWED